MNHSKLLLAALTLAASTADAQLGGRSQFRPASYASLSAGLLGISGIADRNSGADWAFGQGIEWRFSIEHAIQNQTGIGLTVAYASMPLDYYPGASGSAVCGNPCDARAAVWSILTGFHMGGGLGFHQVIEVDAGITQFSNFRTDDGERLDAEKQSWDFAASIAYGFGIGITPRLSFSVVQGYGMIFHPDRGSGSSTGYPQTRVTRLGMKYGMGLKR